MEPTQADLLTLDIDTRLSSLWREMDMIEEWGLDNVAAFVRAAYGRGYCDALSEPQRGLLCTEHGYRVPEQR